MKLERIIRRCALKDMYDSGGYCETKILKYHWYYEAIYEDGGEVCCSDCMLRTLIANRETSFIYEDLYLSDCKRYEEEMNKEKKDA